MNRTVPFRSFSTHPALLSLGTLGIAAGVLGVLLLAWGRAEPPAPAVSAAAPAVAAAAVAADADKFENYKADVPFDPDTKFEMLAIKGGKITIGGKEVEVKDFWMEKTETTWDEYNAFRLMKDVKAATPEATEQEKAKLMAPPGASRPSRPYADPTYGAGQDGHPVMCETLHAAQEYCQWLSAKTGKKYRLPTETEWEYAARCGGPPIEPLTKAQAEKIAIYKGNADGLMQPVGQKDANKWGLQDMLGNAAEWCTEKDGTNPCARGGSFQSAPGELSSSARAVQDPTWNKTDPQNPKSTWWLSDGMFVGFRVVREP